MSEPTPTEVLGYSKDGEWEYVRVDEQSVLDDPAMEYADVADD